MRATFPFSEFLIQADRELHRARQPAFVVVAGLPRLLGASANDEELLRYLHFAVSLDPVSEEVSAAPRVRSVCPMCHQWQDFDSRAIHRHLQIERACEADAQLSLHL